ncbi:Homoserine O-acetyltransferase [gamma proteobacterium IMCC2047]|nr:Homoserine O-acetyltransferase [gamma proteobacterium IMCC2047]
MPESIPKNSVGLVTPQTMKFDTPLTLDSGHVLNSYEIVYETYGELNAEKSNAVLICHALSGTHHAAGYNSMEDKKPGWWDTCIGPGKAIDTNKFYVVCPNNIGGCNGSTGPNHINPETGKYWGPDFPPLRVRDWVKSQACLADKLGIEQWAAIVGGSLGGMQVMRWSLEYPERLRHAVVIASAMNLTAQNIAFNEVARTAIRSDDDYNDGYFLEKGTIPRKGLALARMVGHLTYLTDDLMGSKFGRELRSGDFERGAYNEVQFQVESYLQYQGEKFSTAFDANTYIMLTRVLDYFDLAREYDNDPVKAFSNALCKFFVVSFTTDWRFSPERSQEIKNALISAGKDVSYAEIETPQGHDAFLLPIEPYLQVFDAYMKRIAGEIES